MHKMLDSGAAYELAPMFDSRLSFYGKAVVYVDGDRRILRSYTTDVAEIGPDGPVVYGTYSATTLRHVKEFLRQSNYRADTKAQIMRDYMNK